MAPLSACELLQFVPLKAPAKRVHVLAISSASRSFDCVLVTVDPSTGSLNLGVDTGADVFPSLKAARAYLQKSGNVSVRSDMPLPRGRAQVRLVAKVVLGCAVVANNVWLLFATELGTKPAVMLPGGHAVYQVSATQWEHIALDFETPFSEQDFRRSQMLLDFPFAGYHYFCETADITRPWPSAAPVTSPSWEFVWNFYLGQPFRRIGLPGVAPHILQVGTTWRWEECSVQGLAEARTVQDVYDNSAQLILFARRSRLHAGTRYKARGLNKDSGAANEIECEQLLLCPPRPNGDGAGRWASYVWRRGSVPLHWTQTVKSNGVGTAISILPDHTFKGSRRYFRRLQLRYHRLAQPLARKDAMAAAPAEARAASRELPVVIINLLRKGSMERDRSEAKLYAAFNDLLTALRAECGLNVINRGLDWHELSAIHGGLAPVVQMLWGISEEYYRLIGFSSGRVGAERFVPGNDTVAFGADAAVARDQTQRGVFRFNCADSLDRTNVASYYSAFQVLLEMGRSLGFHFAKFRGFVPSAPAATFRPDAAAGGGRGAGMTKAGKLFGNFASRMGSMASGIMTSSSTAALSSAGRATSTDVAEPQAPADGESGEPGEVGAAAENAAGGEWEHRHFLQKQGDTTVPRKIWINHRTKETRWEMPVPDWQPWELVASSVAAIRQLTPLPLLLTYKDLFRVSGDRNAELYTGSAAMHSSQLDLLLPDGDAGHGMAGFFNNAHTAVTRRIKNIISDERTHAIYAMVLGQPERSSEVAASTHNQGVEFTLCAEAGALPIGDDDDSDAGEDALAGRPWPPPRGLGTGAAPPAVVPFVGTGALEQGQEAGVHKSISTPARLMAQGTVPCASPADGVAASETPQPHADDDCPAVLQSGQAQRDCAHEPNLLDLEARLEKACSTRDAGGQATTAADLVGLGTPDQQAPGRAPQELDPFSAVPAGASASRATPTNGVSSSVARSADVLWPSDPLASADLLQLDTPRAMIASSSGLAPAPTSQGSVDSAQPSLI